MKLASKIFRREGYYVTSPFGWRIHPVTKKRTFHSGTDYGTNCQKWAQYAIEDGYIYTTGQDSTSGKYIWVRYPRINRSLLHCHLDSIEVKKGDKVTEGTLLGYTGSTGRATGVHLHLGMTEIGKSTWLDPDKYDYEPASSGEKYTGEFPKLPERGYFNKGDKSDEVKKVQKFINWATGSKIPITGRYLEKTIEGVKKFQGLGTVKLKQDGSYGKATDTKAREFTK